ncbi:MAG: hypothetical protein PVI26_06275 [Chitinispirillia bacterium]
MKISVKENDKFIYVRYVRESSYEFDKIRSNIYDIIYNQGVPKKKDAIIDFANADFLYSPEVGVIAFVASQLRKVNQKLTVLCTEKVEDILKSTNLNKVENLKIGVKK